MSQYPYTVNWPGAQAGSAHEPDYGNLHDFDPDGHNINTAEAVQFPQSPEEQQYQFERIDVRRQLDNSDDLTIRVGAFLISVPPLPRPRDVTRQPQYRDSNRERPRHEQFRDPIQLNQTMGAHQPDLGFGGPRSRDKRPVYQGDPEEQQRNEQQPRPRQPVRPDHLSSGRNSRTSLTSQQAQVGMPESSRAAQNRQKNDERLESYAEPKNQSRPETSSHSGERPSALFRRSRR